MRFPVLLVVVATIAILLCLTLVVPHTLMGAESKGYFDVQAASWLEGRWDMQPLGETFQVNGKYYIYFAPLPALFRVPSAVWPRLAPLFSQYVFLFLACLLDFGAAFLVFRTIARQMNSNPGTGSRMAFLLIAGPASSLIVAASWPSVYHEAIAFGSGFMLLTVWACLEYIHVARIGWLAAVCGFGFCTVMSRQTWLLAVLFLHAAIGWIALRRLPRASTHFRIACASGALVLAGAFSVNFVRFGWSLGPSLRNHPAFQEDSVRFKTTGGSMFHFSNLRTGLANYFAPDMIHFNEEFPYIAPAKRLHLFPESKFDIMDRFISLPWIMGASLLLSALGVSFALRSGRLELFIPLLACWLGSAPLFLFVGFSGRYMHDFYPPLLLGAAVGLIGLQGARVQILIIPTLAVLIGCNLWANMALAFHIQAPLYGRLAPLVILTSYLRGPRAVHLGESKYSWGVGQPLTIRYRFIVLERGGNYPLLTTGETGAANFVWLRIGPTGLAQYCFNSWGNPVVPCSPEFVIHVGEAHIFESIVDEGKKVIVRHDGKTAIESNQLPHHIPFCWIGENLAGGGLTIEKAPAQFEVLPQPVQP